MNCKPALRDNPDESGDRVGGRAPRKRRTVEFVAHPNPVPTKFSRDIQMKLEKGQRVKGYDNGACIYTGTVYNVTSEDATIMRDDGRDGCGCMINEPPYNGSYGWRIRPMEPNSELWGADGLRGRLEILTEVKSSVKRRLIIELHTLDIGKIIYILMIKEQTHRGAQFTPNGHIFTASNGFLIRSVSHPSAGADLCVRGHSTEADENPVIMRNEPAYIIKLKVAVAEYNRLEGNIVPMPTLKLTSKYNVELLY